LLEMILFMEIFFRGNTAQFFLLYLALIQSLT
jgi:hypothetical protein